MKILISPYSKALRNGKPNPKNYPYWEEVVKILQENGHTVVQLRYGDEQKIEACKTFVIYTTFKVAEELADTCSTFISVDNFFPHLAHYRKKYGVVLWGKSDPALFGYPENVNLLKDPKFLRNHQFETWEADEFDPNAFVEPQIVVEAVQKIMVLKN